MERIVECVPNFSEGRRPEVIRRLVQEIESVSGTTVLDTHIDPDHNRSVITFVAPPETVVEAALRSVRYAASAIDMRLHSGCHPRIGATDVLPFVPIAGVTMEECVALAHEAGRRVADELSIPVYYYERAAMRPERARLEDVRRGGYERLAVEIGVSADREPDCGPGHLHETAGAIIIGARPVLIAFNVNLETGDLNVAKSIARAVRERNGGMVSLKAIGVELTGRGIVQVSMNLVDYHVTDLHHAFEAVRREAGARGISIAGSELVGLVPRSSLYAAAAAHLRLENFSTTAVLEDRLESLLTP